MKFALVVQREHLGFCAIWRQGPRALVGVLQRCPCHLTIAVGLPGLSGLSGIRWRNVGPGNAPGHCLTGGHFFCGEEGHQSAIHLERQAATGALPGLHIWRWTFGEQETVAIGDFGAIGLAMGPAEGCAQAITAKVTPPGCWVCVGSCKSCRSRRTATLVRCSGRSAWLTEVQEPFFIGCMFVH